MPRTFESPDANAETGRQLRQFFTDLLDDTNLREYHENTEAYVASQVKAGVINDATAQADPPGQPAGHRGQHQDGDGLRQRRARVHRLSAHVSGSLVVVGAGIGFARITLEARAAIAAADEVLYLVPDPVSATGIEALNPSGAVAPRLLRGRRLAPRRLRADDRGDPRAGAGRKARLRGVLRPPGRLRPALARGDQPRARRGIRRLDAARRLRRGLPRRRPRRRSRRERPAELRGGRLPAPASGDRADDCARALADRRRGRANAHGERRPRRRYRSSWSSCSRATRPATGRWCTKRRPIRASRRSIRDLRLDELGADTVTLASTLYVPPVPR